MIAPRLWQVSIATTAEGEEAVAGLLERTFELPSSAYRSEATGGVVVTVYPEELCAPPEAVREKLGKALEDMRGMGLDVGPARIDLRPLRRENWAESWKRHFHPIEIGRRLLLKPAWSRRRAHAGQRVVILNPGLSFGTGQHPTTLFCLRQLTRFRRADAEQSFLDIGCGSGILAIAAAKLGYDPVGAFDFDPEAVRASRQNIKRNKVRVQLRQADLTRQPLVPRRRYDFICANLISTLLISEAERIRNCLKPGGKLVVAGVLHREFADVAKKLQVFNLTLEGSKVDKDWKSGQFALLQSRVSPGPATARAPL